MENKEMTRKEIITEAIKSVMHDDDMAQEVKIAVLDWLFAEKRYGV